MYIKKNVFFKRVSLLALMILGCLSLDAQIALYPLMTSGSNPPTGTTSVADANVTPGTVTVGANITSTPAGSYNSTGLSIKLISGPTTWANTNTTGYNIDIPLNPKASFFFTLSSISFTTTSISNAEPLFAEMAYDANNSGVFTSLAPAVSCNSVGTFTITGISPTLLFKAPNTYVFRLFFKGTNTTKNQNTRIKNLTFNGSSFGYPVVHTTSLKALASVGANFSADATGTFTTGSGIQATTQSGFCWAGQPTVPTVLNSTNTVTGTTASGVTTISATIPNLSVGTTYNVRTYVITATDTIYGETIAVKAQAIPTLNTNSPSNVLSNKATTGGNTIDSGSMDILEKGVLYATNNSLVYPGTSHTSDGTGSANYVTTIKNLLPNTKYYIKAYARNALGVGYGNLDSFTTAAPVPSIIATPGNLDFGDVTYNTTAPVLSYKVNASYLTPVAGTITLNASTGYTVCATLNGLYNTTLTLNYTGSSIANKIIYVKSSSVPYGTLNGKILHTGGGAVAPNADTTFLVTNVIQNPDTLSNAGSDFWTGFAFHYKMKEATTQFDTLVGSATGAHMSLFIAAGTQSDSVIVELPNMPSAFGFPRKVFVPANGVVEVGGFPVGDGTPTNPTGGADSRLFYTGISNRGIHIYSKSGVPVSCWLYDWETNNSAAGAMLFPTNTWNSSYVVQAMGGKANSSNYFNNSFFFVIAKDDNTTITFKPTNDIVDSNGNTIFKNFHQHNSSWVKYFKDSTYSITLNKGQVFNAMGFVGDPDPANTSDPGALDLSGTIVSTSCDKKIAVFGGNGRCLLGTRNCTPTMGNTNCSTLGKPTQGSDNMVQQMFPKVAWGTKYLTVPTKNMADNVFRVYVQDITTKVWLNNNLLSPINLINNLYYQFDVYFPSKVESDKPISVTQFITSGSECENKNYGNIGKGDPEMITLSPVQQSIKNTTVYSAIFKNNNQPPSNGCSYINVVVKGFDGVSNFKLDGLTSGIDTGGNTFTGAIYAAASATTTNVNAFRKHPYDTSYYYATFRVASKAKHTLSATQGFNAIAYGVSDGESYGYNAGTTINNLSAIKFSLNPYGSDTSTTSVKTCKGNLVTLQIALPYDTSTVNSIIWDAGNDGTRYSPTGPQVGVINPSTTKPVVTGTIVRDGRTFYIYKSPVKYTFFEEGAYKVKVTVNGTFASDCGGTDIQYMNVIVGHDDISFTATPAGCGSRNVTISDATTPLAGTSIVKWNWNFGDNTKDSASVGDSWAPNPSAANNPHTYPANNAYYIKLTTINSAGCFSYDSVLVDLAFGINTSFTSFRDTACVGENITFTPTSSANAAKWFWDFGDASPIDSSNTSANAVSHSYTNSGSYIVSHWVKTSAGCPSAVVKDTVVVSKTPVASFVTPSGVCLPGNTQFTNSSDTSALGAATPYTYHWGFGTGNAGDTSNVKNPVFGYSVAPPNAVTLIATSRFGCVSSVYSQTVSNVYTKPTAAIANTSSKKVCVGSNASFFDASSGTSQTVNSWYWNFGDGGTSTQQNPTHSYTTNGTDSVKLVIGTDKGCVSDTITQAIKVNPKPVAGTILPSSCITSGSLFFQDKSTLASDADVQTPYSYTWTFGDGSGTFTTKDSTHTYAGIGTYYINHSITTLNGCTDTKTDTFKISGSKPISKYSVIDQGGLGLRQFCARETISLVDSSTIAIGTISKVVIFWDTSATRYLGANLSTTPTIDNTPQNGVIPIAPKTYTFKYPYSLTSKNPTIKIVTYNSDSCYNETFIPITIFGQPNLKFDTIRGVCLDGTPKKINFAYDSTGFFDAFNYIRLFKNPTYNGSGVYNDSMFNPLTAGVGTHLIQVIYETKQPTSHHCFDTAYAPITVWALPTVKFDTALIKCEGNSILFNDQSTAGAGSGNISSWLWNFGNPSSGTNDTASKQNPTHNYSNYGSYNVTLKVTSDSGCSNTSTPKTVTINPRPKAGFKPPAGVCQGQASVFTDTSKLAYGTFVHSWNFGDPTSATNTASGTYNPTPSHQYSGGVTDTIRLVVTSDNGCVDSAKAAVNNSITFPPITPRYLINGNPWDTTNTKGVCVNGSLKFTSAFKANDYTWSFGDSVGVINKGANVNHTFSTVNNFTGNFSMIDSNGCPTRAIPIKVTVWALPTPVIQVNNPTCEKQNTLFNDNSTAGAGTGNIASWLWKFGDPATGVLDSSNAKNPVHYYNVYGNYNVYLTVTSDSGGCKATVAVPTIVNIHPKPKVTFVLPTSVCLPLAAQFTDTSKIADGTESQFTHFWSFGDLSSGANNYATGKPLPIATHTYSTSGNDTIMLKIKSVDGCEDSARKVLPASAIHNRPHADYTVNTTSKDTPRICIGNTITFKDASTNVKTSYWIWDINNSGVELGLNPAPQYGLASPGEYNGQHFIDDNFGCRSDTAGFLAIIDSFPVVNGGEKYILEGRSEVLTPYISGAASVLWTLVTPTGLLDDYLDYNDVETPLCTPPLLDSIVYRIDAKSGGGCPAPSVSFTVKVFSEPNIPNAFSPNGDGINDTWDIGSLQYFTGSTVQVFTRGGQLVFNSLGYSRPWKGTDLGGNPLPVGVYYYIIKPGLGLQPRSGSITILR